MDSGDAMAIVVILIIVIGIGALVFTGINGYNNYMQSQKTSKITVSEKWIKNSASDGYDEELYLVSDTNGNVYKIEDESAVGVHDASNTYAILKANKTYEITTIGWRNPQYSDYPNILNAHEVAG